MRKPVAAIQSETEEGPSVVVICDDGAVFELQAEPDDKGSHWKQWPGVPGTQESSDQTKEEFLGLAIRYFREHMEAVTGPTLEGEAARHLEEKKIIDHHAQVEAAAARNPGGEEVEEGARIQFREPGPLVQKTAEELLDAPRFFCASPKCPGYPFKASARSHPEDVCGIPERHLDRPEPAAATRDKPTLVQGPRFCKSPRCPGYSIKASEHSHPEETCPGPKRHLDRPEAPPGDEPYRGADL